MKHKTAAADFKPTISPGQALLILIKAYKSDPDMSARLKKMYFLGVENADKTPDIKGYLDIPETKGCSQQEMDAFLSDPLLTKYIISTTAKTIDQDPTRRFFETHFAYHTLINHAKDIKPEDLDAHEKNVFGLIPSDIQKKIDYVLQGNMMLEDENPHREYAHYINLVNKGDFLPEIADRKLLQSLFRCTYLSTVGANQNNTIYPIKIYGIGLFNANRRGGEPKDLLYDNTESANFGLLRANMPTPSSDITRATAVTPFSRGADNTTYIPQALWVRANFNKMVHPFSNSISGTILASLRTLAYLKKLTVGKISSSAEEINKYIRLQIVTLLLASGGHSLYEYVAVLFVKEIRAEFADMVGFAALNMESMFFSDNQEALNKALDAAIVYNEFILQKVKIHAQIKTFRIEPGKTLFDSILECTSIKRHITSVRTIYSYFDYFIEDFDRLAVMCLVPINSLKQDADFTKIPDSSTLLTQLETLLDEGKYIEANEQVKKLEAIVIQSLGPVYELTKSGSEFHTLLQLVNCLDPSQKIFIECKEHVDNYIGLWNLSKLDLNEFSTQLDQVIQDKSILKDTSIQMMEQKLGKIYTTLIEMEGEMSKLKTVLEAYKVNPFLNKVKKQQNAMFKSKEYLDQVKQKVAILRNDSVKSEASPSNFSKW